MKRVKMVCATCGSEDVYGTASMSWNVDTQTWEAGDPHDYFDCGDCNDECDVKAVEIEDA